MLVGHYGPAFAIKAVRPQMPLGLLFVAVQLGDIAWATLVLCGVEKVRIIPGFNASNPLDLYFMPYTHSLLAAGLWSIGCMIAYRYVPRVRPWTLAALLALAVFSHWLLDLVVHTEDLPLYGDSYKVGFGLWNLPLISLALEIGLVLVGAWFMETRGAIPDPGSRRRTILLCLSLTGIQLYSLFGPIPATPQSMAMTTLPLYAALAAWAWWHDRQRISQSA